MASTQPRLNKQKAYISSDIDFKSTQDNENLPPSDPPSESEDKNPILNIQTSDDVPLMTLLQKDAPRFRTRSSLQGCQS